MSEPLNSDPNRRWIQQQRRPLPPRTVPPSDHQPATMPAPAAYQQRAPHLQRSSYQQGRQYPPYPQPRQVGYSQYAPTQQAPTQQAPYYPPVLQYPAIANPYPPPAHHGPQAGGRGRGKRSTIGLLAGGGVVALVLAVVLGLGMAKVMSLNGNQLDLHQAEADVKQILTDTGYGYGIDNITAISCNNGVNPQVEKGAGFTCDVVVDGAKRRVAVVFVDDQGSYEVDRPR